MCKTIGNYIESLSILRFKMNWHAACFNKHLEKIISLVHSFFIYVSIGIDIFFNKFITFFLFWYWNLKHNPTDWYYFYFLLSLWNVHSKSSNILFINFFFCILYNTNLSNIFYSIFSIFQLNMYDEIKFIEYCTSFNV